MEEPKAQEKGAFRESRAGQRKWTKTMEKLQRGIGIGDGTENEGGETKRKLDLPFAIPPALPPPHAVNLHCPPPPPSVSLDSGDGSVFKE
jgi:hypothetical protein